MAFESSLKPTHSRPDGSHVYSQANGPKIRIRRRLPKTIRRGFVRGDNKHVGFIDIIGQTCIDESQNLKREIQTLR